MFKICRNATDQKARIQTGIFQYPGQKGAGCCFTVRACHGQHMTPPQDIFTQPLRTRCIRQLFVQNCFKQRVATRNRVPDHIKIGVDFELVNVKTFNKFNSSSGQLVTHWRINICVTACHAMTGRTSQLGDSTHEGSANS